VLWSKLFPKQVEALGRIAENAGGTRKNSGEGGRHERREAYTNGVLSKNIVIGNRRNNRRGPRVAALFNHREVASCFPIAVPT